MTSSSPLPGFTLQRLLGRGNSANVYLATDQQGRKVALKLPFPETLQDPGRAERFANEVRLSLQLKHVHLVVGHEGIPFGEGSYLSMRYFPEGTLMRWLDLGKLSDQEGLRIMADVARALVFLHGQGVVHQDVKSQNVYLDDGRAALGDLGTAYFLTQGGKTAGSPFYMAPEIYLGEASSSASDVYSLGVLAYEVLSGGRPFRGQSYDELMAAHLSSFPKPLASLVPTIPRALSQLIERAFSKAASDRPDALSLARGFESALGRPASEDQTPGSSRGSQAAQAAPMSPAAPVTLGRHSTPGAAVPTAPAAPGPAPDPAQRPSFWERLKKRSSR